VLTEFEYTAQLSDSGKRVDHILDQHLLEFSRSQIQRWIKEGHLTINKSICKKQNKILKHHDQLILTITPPTPLNHLPEEMTLDIVHEDEHIIVINKPSNLTVHPGAGNHDGTLLNGLLMHEPSLTDLPRAGIVHRLDKDTSGLMVIAKTTIAQNTLIEMIKNRDVTRIYLALTWGQTPLHFSVDAPIGRHKTKRTQMTVTPAGKTARTHFEALEHFDHFTLLRCKLETGRTHQIRVHLLYKDFPIVGDSTYHKKIRLSKPIAEIHQRAIQLMQRQFLHAHQLAFSHPITNEPLKFTCSLPQQLQTILDQLK
jgi:23S rRNA pseudouridine1911/1915/1917 synthase